MGDLHDIQMKIIRKLLYAESLRYSDLRPGEDIENNKLQFHIDKLLAKGWIEKLSDGTYALTLSGKSNANRIDTSKAKFQKQGIIFVFACALREINGDTEVLLYERKNTLTSDLKGFRLAKLSMVKPVKRL